MIGSIISGFAALGQLPIASNNAMFQREMADKNFQLQQQAYDWQKSVDTRNFDYMAQMNQIQMNREDTAHQREVQDLMKAGLSPLANKAGATTGNVVSQGATPTPSTPQYDGSTVSNAYANIQSALSRVADTADLFAKLKSDEKVNSARNAIDLQIANENNLASLTELEKALASNEKIEDKKLAQSQKQFVSQLKQDLEIHTEMITAENARQAKAQAHEIKQYYRSQGVTEFQTYKPHQFKEYQYAWSVRNQALNRFIEKHKHLLESSDSASGGFRILNYDTGANVQKYSNKSQEYYELLKEFNATHPVPIME